MLVLGLSLAAALLMSFTAKQVLDSALRRDLEADLSAEVDRVATAVMLWHQREREKLARCAKDPILVAALAMSPEGDAAARRRLTELLEDERDVLGYAVVEGAGRVRLSVSPWLPEDWAERIEGLPVDRGTAAPVRIGSRVAALVVAPLPLTGRHAVLWAAANPSLGLDVTPPSPNGFVAILDERGELIAGTSAAAELSLSRGFSEATNAEGARFLALDRELADLPWRAVIAKPMTSAPTTTIWNVVLMSVLIGFAAGLVAFAVAARRLRPLLALADGARRLAAGETGVRVRVRDAEDEVQTLARSFNEMAGQLDSQRQALEERNQALLHANEVLEQLSITDGLTRLHNHRHFHDQFAREAKRANRSGHSLCLMLVDVDDFKRLNDQHGHAAGDRVLATAAQLMNEQVRESDYLARYGGEEFAMLLPQTTLEGAVALAEKIRAVLSEHTFVLQEDGAAIRVTVSIGVAEHLSTADETFNAADHALYEAKAAGKDCVVAASREPSGPAPMRRRR